MFYRLLLTCALGLLPTAAGAAVTLFDVSGTLDNGATFDGTIGIDTADGVTNPVTTIDITGTAGRNRFDAFHTTTLISAGKLPSYDYYEIIAGNAIRGPYVELRLHVPTLVGFTGAGLCPVFNTEPLHCGFGSFISSGANGFLLSGNILPADAQGAVPEPATWALLMAGFGATGAALRRRNRTALATA